MKHVLVLFAIILVLLPEVYADEGKWIDGIKFRVAVTENPIDFHLPGETGPSKIIERNTYLKHMVNPLSFPITLTLPETLMTSWSFRGGLFEWDYSGDIKDLAPANQGSSKEDFSSDTTNLRQDLSLRTSLYNNFFNASDRAFADANSNWALSADATSSRIFLGYYWGVFIPLGEYHRLAKIGLGLGVYYLDLSYKLNLCSEYKIYFGGGGANNTTRPTTTNPIAAGECVGKSEIDSVSGKALGGAIATYLTIWERLSKYSVWKLLTFEQGSSLTTSSFPLKHHTKDLEIDIYSVNIEILSYTYRFQ